MNSGWNKTYQEAKRLHEESRWGSTRISKTLGVSESTIRTWIYENASPQGKHTHTVHTLQEYEHVMRLVKQGKRPLDVAKSLNIKYRTVTEWIRGKPPREIKRPNKEILTKLYWDKRQSLSQIAKVYDLSSGYVLQIFKQYGIKRRTRSEAQIVHQGERLPDKETLYDLYWNKGLSLRKIAKRYKLRYASVQLRFIKYKIKRRDYAVYVNLTSSHELSYCLGVILGDGCVSYNKKTHGGVVELEVIDKLFAEKFAKSLAKIGFRPNMIVKKDRGKEKDTYCTYACSNTFYRWYTALTLKDIGRIIRGYEKEFVRGFYESEGSIETYTRLQITISNTNYELLRVVQDSLEVLGIHSKIYTNKVYPTRKGYNTCYRIAISNREGVLNFLGIIAPCIKNLKKNLAG